MGSPPTRPSNASSPESAAAEAHRVVVDTNVWLAGLYKRDQETASYTVLNAVRAGRLRLCISRTMAAELSWMVVELATKKDDRVDRYMVQRGLRNLVSFLQNGYEHIEPKVELKACAAHPDDDKFVDCAYAAETMILSKNYHLLDLDGTVPLKSGARMRIIAPEHFQAAYQQEGMTRRL